jgi:V8-like Glu-specific endopeptidase
VCTAAIAAASLAPAGSPAHAVVGEPELGATYAFTARLNIGQGQRACSGSLVESQWILTAASCFADSPSQPTTVPAGKPKLATTATIGRQDDSTGAGQVRDIVELVPRADRDLVLAKLSKPVTGITPVTVTASQPMAGERLTIAGYGRTRDEWAPNKLHIESLDVSAVTGSTLDLSGQAPADGGICKGDAGGPTLRKMDGRLELVGVHSATNEAGCLGSQGTLSHARETRLDDVRSWIAAHVARWSMKANANNKYVVGEFNDSGNQKGKLRARSDAPAGSWEQFTLHVNGTGTVSLRSLNENLYVSVEVNDTGTLEGMLRARNATAGGWERLKLEEQSEGMYAIKSMQNGKYVTSEINDAGGNYGLLRARTTTPGGWERFSFERVDNFKIIDPQDALPEPIPTS